MRRGPTASDLVSEDSVACRQPNLVYFCQCCLLGIIPGTCFSPCSAWVLSGSELHRLKPCQGAANKQDGDSQRSSAQTRPSRGVSTAVLCRCEPLHLPSPSGVLGVRIETCLGEVFCSGNGQVWLSLRSVSCMRRGRGQRRGDVKVLHPAALKLGGRPTSELSGWLSFVYFSFFQCFLWEGLPYSLRLQSPCESA